MKEHFELWEFFLKKKYIRRFLALLSLVSREDGLLL